MNEVSCIVDTTLQPQDCFGIKILMSNLRPPLMKIISMPLFKLHFMYFYRGFFSTLGPRGRGGLGGGDRPPHPPLATRLDLPHEKIAIYPCENIVWQGDNFTMVARTILSMTILSAQITPYKFCARSNIKSLRFISFICQEI